MIPSASLLTWLRELPSRRVLHTLRLISALLLKHGEPTWQVRLDDAARDLGPLLEEDQTEPTAAMMQSIVAFFDRDPSIHTLRLSDRAGHKIRPDDVPAVNAYLGALTIQLLLSARQALARIHWRR